MNENQLNKLEYHIDDPIKKCVVGMALLGFTPIFSCCGFNYIGERIAKSHILEKPYIYIHKTKMDDKLKSLLIDICCDSSWNISMAGNEYIDFHGWKWNNNHPWSVKGCLHKPEMPVLALSSLEKVLEKLKDKFHTITEIKDGNEFYKIDLKLKHWQYPACQPWEVTPEIFDKL